MSDSRPSTEQEVSNAGFAMFAAATHQSAWSRVVECGRQKWLISA